MIKFFLNLDKFLLKFRVHFVGNYGYIDSRGFLIVDDNTEKDLSEMHVSHRIDGVSLIKESRKKKMDETLKDCCWICEGWNECTFNWIPGEHQNFL